jgi:hypothetical protein
MNPDGYNTATKTGGHHIAQNPVTGETNVHSTQTGAALDQGWQDLKTQVPGTTEHRATHPNVMGTTGTTGAGAAAGYGPGYTETGATGTKFQGTTGTTGTPHVVENPATGKF